MSDGEHDNESDSSKDNEKRLINIYLFFINYNSNDDDKRDVKDKLMKYVQLKRIIQENNYEGDNEDGDRG